MARLHTQVKHQDFVPFPSSMHYSTQAPASYPRVLTCFFCTSMDNLYMFWDTDTPISSTSCTMDPVAVTVTQKADALSQ